METIDRVKALVGDQVGCPASEIDAETPFKELDLDSLDRIELGMAIEEHFHLDIPDADMENDAHGTPAGIAAYLDGRKADWGTFTGKSQPRLDEDDAPPFGDGPYTAVTPTLGASGEEKAVMAIRSAAIETATNPTGIEGKSMPIYGIRKADFDELRRIIEVQGLGLDRKTHPLSRAKWILDGIAEDESKSRGYMV